MRIYNYSKLLSAEPAADLRTVFHILITAGSSCTSGAAPTDGWELVLQSNEPHEAAPVSLHSKFFQMFLQ